MIKLKTINNKDIVLNCELIENIKLTPDTTITMTNGKKVIVRDSIDEIIEKTIEYKKKLFYNSI